MESLLPTLIEWMGVIAVTLILSLSPAIRQRRPVKFVYSRREVIISLALVAVIAGVVVWAFPAIFPGSVEILPDGGFAPVSGKTFQYDPARLVRQIEMSFLILAPFLLALAVRRQPLLSVGLSRPSLRAGLQLGLALALISIFLSGKIYAILNGLTTAQGLFLVAAAVAAFAEEVVFRGYVQLRLAGWLGETGGWLATAVIYTAWRFALSISAGGAVLPDVALRLAVLLGLALLLGWIMRKSGSVLATTIYHAVHTWIQIL